MVPATLARTGRRVWSAVRAGTQAWPAAAVVIDAVRRHAGTQDAAG